MIVKLLTENRLEFLSLKEGCTGSSESALVKIPHCWKSRHGSYVFRVHRLKCPNVVVFLSLGIIFVLANSSDP